MWRLNYSNPMKYEFPFISPGIIWWRQEYLYVSIFYVLLENSMYQSFIHCVLLNRCAIPRVKSTATCFSTARCFVISYIVFFMFKTYTNSVEACVYVNLIKAGVGTFLCVLLCAMCKFCVCMSEVHVWDMFTFFT